MEHPEFQKRLLKDPLDFFGTRNNEFFFSIFGMQELVKKVTSETKYCSSNSSTYHSYLDDSLATILSIFESKKGVNTIKISNKIMDSRPKFGRRNK